MEVTSEYRAIFVEETAEHLEEWESALLQLEQDPSNRELIDQMFRAIHTLKGSAGFIGFEKLQHLAHSLESTLQDVRDGTAALSSERSELLFTGLDLCRRMVLAFETGGEFAESVEPFLERLQTVSASPPGEAPPHGAEDADGLRPGSTDGSLPETAPAGSPAGAGSKRFTIRLRVTATGREAYLRAFLVRSRLAPVATILKEDPAPEIFKDGGGAFDYAVTVATDVEESELLSALNIDQLEILTVEEAAETARPDERERDQTETPHSLPARGEEVVRVSVERLDNLLNLVGELVIQNSGFSSVTEELKSRFGKSHLVDELDGKTEKLAKITRDLQDGIMKVRMLPVSNVFNRFYRVVRDLARDRGKEVTLDVFGGETEIDKKVMDRISDPLVHLVRNAVDHGIEDGQMRRAAGKAPIGLVRLGAYQDGDHICIEVSDDGRGLDRDAILRKAIERGLLVTEQSEAISEEGFLELIFLPGFSTAEEITEISGRGVGMDAVKRTIEGLGGTIRLRSVAGRGTTVTISLPLTMAIIPAVLAKIGEVDVAVPLSAVSEVLKVAEAELQTVGTRRVIRLREQVFSMVSLSEALSLGECPDEREEGRRLSVVIVEYDGKRIGLSVDRVEGTREIVIKSLSRHYREIEGLIGASILGNGKIALIVDVEAIVRVHYHAERPGGGTAMPGAPVSTRGGIPARREDPGAPTAVPEEATGPGVDAPKAVPDEATGQRVDASTAVGEEAAGPREDAATEIQEEAAGAKEDAPIASTVEPMEAPDATEDLAAGATGPRVEVLEEINNAGALQASLALSQMLGREVRVSFPQSEVLSLSEIPGMLGGPEAPIGGIYVGIQGDLSGGMLFVLPEEQIEHLLRALYRSPEGDSDSSATLDPSGLAELANILSASFINSMADTAKLLLHSEAPEMTVDMCESVIDSVISRFNQPGEGILLTKALLYLDESDEVVCNLLMFLEPGSMTRLVSLLAGEER